MRFIPYVAAEQPLNKQFLQMQRHLYDRDIIGCVASDMAVWDENGYCQIFWSEKDINYLKNIEGKKLLDAITRKKIIKAEKKEIKQYWASAAELLQGIERGLDRTKLADLYKIYTISLRRIFAHFITSTAYATFSVEDALRKDIVAKYSGDINEAYSILTTPLKEDILFQEKKDWLKLNQITDNKLITHYKKYSVIAAYIFTEDDVLRLARKRLREENVKEIRKEIERAEINKHRVRLKQKELLKAINSKSVDDISLFLQEMAIVRLQLKACWNGESLHMMPFFKKLSQLTGVSIVDIYMFYTADDVYNILQNEKILPNKLLTERKKHCFVYLHDKKIQIYNGNSAVKAKKRILEKSITSLHNVDIKGLIASKGKVTGIARVVKIDNPEDINEMAKKISKEDILVTGMTNPTMMILIRKVKGIITDEGGIACHAAIISREFNIPCIVGTSIATHVLKDGDKIELDANKGIVRKLSV